MPDHSAPKIVRLNSTRRAGRPRSQDCTAPQTVRLNGRAYAFPRRPVVVVCIDGCDPAYLRHGEAGTLPNFQRFRRDGFAARAEAVIPTFTNPNNLSIVTGSLPEVHGVSGNYFLDQATGRTAMLSDSAYLRSDTLLARFSRAGARVAVVTAKDKLRRLLGAGLMHGPCFSAEAAAASIDSVPGIEAACEMVGLSGPEQIDVYSAEASLFVLAAGVTLLDRWRPDLTYLSLTDYVQHKHPPGSSAADRFYAALDTWCGRLAETGAVVALTADHGMNAKPRVIFLQDVLDAAFGVGTTRVICPITDPYVVHHGALGSCVQVYCHAAPVAAVREAIAHLAGVDAVYERDDACRRFGLPADREADLLVLGDRETALGAAERDHDLSGLGRTPLRSHGGRAEQTVPFLVSDPVGAAYRDRAHATGLRNFDLFDYVLNGT